MEMLPPEFQSEPRMALAGGRDGMDLVDRILAEAAGHLQPDGLLVLEIGHEAEHFERAFPRLEHHWLAVSAGDRMISVVEARSLRRAFSRFA
jgi:ribosomal protein L3 glutamine methyltransferase